MENGLDMISVLTEKVGMGNPTFGADVTRNEGEAVDDPTDGREAVARTGDGMGVPSRDEEGVAVFDEALLRAGDDAVNVLGILFVVVKGALLGMEVLGSCSDKAGSTRLLGPKLMAGRSELIKPLGTVTPIDGRGRLVIESGGMLGIPILGSCKVKDGSPTMGEGVPKLTGVEVCVEDTTVDGEADESEPLAIGNTGLPTGVAVPEEPAADRLIGARDSVVRGKSMERGGSERGGSERAVGMLIDTWPSESNPVGRVIKGRERSGAGDDAWPDTDAGIVCCMLKGVPDANTDETPSEKLALKEAPGCGAESPAEGRDPVPAELTIPALCDAAVSATL